MLTFIDDNVPIFLIADKSNSYDYNDNNDENDNCGCTYNDNAEIRIMK
jgi:hypothetical protein